MRWILLLLIPCVAFAADLAGVWSKVNAGGENGINRVVIVDGGDRIYFHYESDGGHRCEVMGMAQRHGARGRYVFKNDKQHHLYEGYEGYGFEEHRDCEISFEHDGVTLKVRSHGNCASFCGMNGSIGGDLFKVPGENLTVTQPPG